MLVNQLLAFSFLSHENILAYNSKTINACLCSLLSSNTSCRISFVAAANVVSPAGCEGGSPARAGQHVVATVERQATPK